MSQTTTSSATIAQPETQIIKPQTSRAKQSAIGFMIGAVAACCAVTLTNPMEVVKTRLQLQGELARTASGTKNVPKPYTNLFQAAILIFKNEGIRGIQKGLGPAYGYQIMMNGARLGFYEPIKHTYNDLLGNDPTKHHTLVNMLSGASSGLIGAAFGSPLFLVKTRMQSYSQHAGVGHQHYYRNSVAALREIWKTDGIRGWFRGVDAAMLRTAVGSAVQLPTYGYVKSKILQSNLCADNIYAHVSSSLISGIFVCCVMQPFDVVSTRMYNQKTDPITGKGTLYRNPLDCMVKTLRAEGFFGLYKGFTAQYARIGPHTIFTFVFFEQLTSLYKRYLRQYLEG
ncbi:uncharacterized protein VTP21DRAFT_11119 [Calcarisporiella thermophila]|uniref:uncharacterized protein n=1 Tax=Calcarisporiella thermophila TaxID=911321 RepID=UPI0037425E9E